MSLYVEAGSLEDISISAAARRVVPLTTDNDLTSLNSFTASQYVSNSYFATTGSNTFNGNQTISGSLDVSGGISVNSITLNGSQLSATGVLNGSYLFAKNANPDKPICKKCK